MGGTSLPIAASARSRPPQPADRTLQPCEGDLPWRHRRRTPWPKIGIGWPEPGNARLAPLKLTYRYSPCSMGSASAKLHRLRRICTEATSPTHQRYSIIRRTALIFVSASVQTTELQHDSDSSPMSQGRNRNSTLGRVTPTLPDQGRHRRSGSDAPKASGPLLVIASPIAGTTPLVFPGAERASLSTQSRH